MEGGGQRTDLSSDVLKGGRTDQGEAYQEHILGENQRDRWLTGNLYVCVSVFVATKRFEFIYKSTGSINFWITIYRPIIK